VWPTLTTNVSRFTSVFSDHVWPDGTPDFPAAGAVADYLAGYARRFGLDDTLRTECDVVALEPAEASRSESGSSGWRVTWEHAGRQASQVFDAVIVASGFFARPAVPRLRGTFDGLLLHSGGYRGATWLSNRRVAVVGMAFSGSEIAAELSREGVAVTAVTSRPFWLLPRYVTPPGVNRAVPLDLYAKTRAARRSESGTVLPERYRKRNRLLSQLAENSRLGEHSELFDNAFALDPDSTEPPHVVISDALAPEIHAGRLALARGRAARLERSAVVLEDGRRIEADAVVWCTGHLPDATFLPLPVRRAVEYDPTDLLQPLVLGNAMFPAGVNGLIFVGMYRGPYFGVVELQARLACAVISRAIPPPSAPDLAREVARARQIRWMRPRPQFPYDDLDLADRIGRMLGVLPPARPSSGAEDVDDADDWFWNSPVVPAHYRMLGAHSAPEIAAGQIREAAARVRAEKEPISG
jgi:dimethylaniline monooxygenase (N-oxide forming)